MFRRLLVPLDGTLEAASALPAARTLARATGAAITLVRVTAGRLDDIVASPRCWCLSMAPREESWG